MIEKVSIKPRKNPDYCIPKAWLFEKYDGPARFENDRVFVEPSRYFESIIEWILEKKEKNIDYNKSLSLHRGVKDRNWVRSAVIYSSLARSTVAYNHKGFGRFESDDILGYRESGTFLKMIALLPHLVKLGVNVLYLLPVTQSSQMFKKGEIGSPYSVKDFLKIDQSYHDPLLEGWVVEDELAALVEACHILGIRVVLDFIPRTSARDCNLIMEHPDWFYWIKIDELASYRPPQIEGLGFCQPDFENMKKIYDRKQVKDHLGKFSFDPKTVDPHKWEKIVQESTEENFMYNIIKYFGLVTAPGFSDWINDSQPTWDDVTFLRLYLDHPATAEGKIRNDQPPYVLFDVIKASRFPGKLQNKELWNYIASVIPHFQRKFGIDGIRLDMGHALPDELEQMIIENARDYDPSFAFFAEELEMHRAKEAKDAGYDLIIGNSWWMLPRVHEKTYEFVQSVAANSELPFIASAETPDTPRIAYREGGKFKYLVPFLCAFVPNGVLMINSGQEIEETQPMNLGLDNDACGRFTLGCEEEFQGKLAFFDHYALHWKDSDLLSFLSEVVRLRTQFLNLIVNGLYKPVYLSWQDGKTANISYWGDGEAIVVIANLDEQQREVSVELEKTYGRALDVESVKTWHNSDWKEVVPAKTLNCKLKGYDFTLYKIDFK
ncbi:MAG TPA: alpha-amylase family glycosyl hydrolase [Pseudothermotoga sp.]|nr:alpha-amylase family glycosyl hydrolase [Pseudothermotoga sp.]HOK82976.1 alpha-amylase family glycosyl hydrolase [Pseudothermotoga sp.]HPP69855.1 alpha-amylase family glycosyl hydrolase [Pseudothermotoga sp.]